MTRKIVSILLALCLLIGCVPMMASAAETSGNCGAAGNETGVTWKIENGTLTISGSGEMADYFAPGPMGDFEEGKDPAPWYPFLDSITSAVIENGVTYIGNLSFVNCGNLASVTLPNSVTSIGASAFESCSSLNGITLPGSLTSIGERAFLDCSDLTSVTIPDTVTSIGEAAFSGCSLTSIVIPNSVTSIEGGAFSGCADLTAIQVAEGNPNYTSEGGVLFNKDKTELLCYPAKKSGAYVIPDSVTTIGDGAFSHCTGLTSVTIPDGVTTIGYGAFSHCTGLTSVTIPDGVTTLEDFAFNSCTGLTSITIPDSITSIGSSAFMFCTGLTSVTIPGSVTSMGDNIFSDCTALTSATILDGVTTIGADAFYGCYTLTSVSIPDSVTTIEVRAFYCTGLTKVTIPDSVTTIGIMAFSYCRSLTSVTIPSSVTTLGGGAFFDDSKLKNVTFEGDAPTVTGEVPPFTVRETDPCIIYYKDGAKGWTTPTWTANGVSYPCKPLSQMNPDQPNPPVTPPSGGDTPDEPVTPTEPVVETETSPDGTVTTTTTWSDGKKAVQEKTPDGGAKVEVTAPTGETIAKVELPADPGAGKEFEDVKEGAWYEGAVDKATAYGLFNGQTETTFAPNGNMTRGMVAQVLYNLSGKTGYGAGSGNFTDVAAGKWYENAIDWAAKANVVSGTGNGSFSPEQPVTREQLVSMLYRYAQAIGASTKSTTGLGSFPDGNSVSDYAKTAMQWAVAEGFISGRNQNGGKYIAPNGTATRAEVAAILTRFVDYLKK